MSKNTREQDLSLMIDRHQAVIANAGSGKTKVLVDRYVNILIDDISVALDPTKIIAITFTRKAAAEMKAKINRKLSEMMNDENLSSPDYNRLREASENMINARISTIHSFCARLLRDFPVEAGLSPDFIELSTTESIKLKQNSIKDTLEDWIEHVAKKPKIVRINNSIPQYTLNDILVSILSRPDKFDSIIKFYDENDNEKLVDLFHQEYSNLNNDNDKKNKYSSDKNIINLHIDIARDLILLAQDCLKNFEKAKENYNGLDFSDLLIKADLLLDDENVRQRIQTETKHILIDEFQDTDRIQYSMVKKIISLGEANKKGVKLFLVGDEKQSIYGFRNAEVEIFNQARNQLAVDNKTMNLKKDININGHLPKDNEIFGEIELKTTFRLKPAVGLFINKLFNNLMNPDESPFDNKYIPFVIHREYNALEEKSKSRDIVLDDSFGSVKFLLAQKTASDDASEAELVANYILEIVQGNAGLKVGNSDSEKYKTNPNFEDIAILARSRSKIDELTNELTNKGIPYYNNSGSSLFKRQEIVDISSILRFINNSRDDISLIGALKSPFFNLNDNDIFKISRLATCDTFWEKLILYKKNHKQDIEIDRLSYLVNRAIALLKKFQVRAGKISLAAFISSIIDDTSVIATFAGNPMQNQIELNLKKFVQIARNFQSRGFKNLYDFIEEIELLEKHSDDSQPADKVKGNIVNILTVHAAKGLQYPIVILYNCNKKESKPDNFLMNEEYGLKYKFTAEHPENKTFEQWDTIQNNIIDEMQKQKDMAEEKRILYVAMSRAEDHLIISGFLKEGKNNMLAPQGFLKMIFNGLEYKPENMNENKQITDDLTILKDDYTEKEYKDITINVDVITELENRKNESLQKQIVNDNKKIMYGHITEKIEGDYFSPTRIMTFEDREKYLLKYELGLPELLENKKDVDKDIKIERKFDPQIGTLYGSIIHSAMENIDIWLKDGIVDNNKLQDLIINQISPANVNVSDFVRSVSEELKSVTVTPLIKDAMNNYEKARKELKLSIPLAKDYLIGTIDLLIYNPETERKEIWDWKSNAFASGDTIDKKAEDYEMQMKIYAYLLYKLEPKHEEYTARLLFTKLAGENKSTEEWTYSFTWTKQELKEAETEIINKINQMKEV